MFTNLKNKIQLKLKKQYLRVLFKIYSINPNLYDYDYFLEKGQHVVYMRNFVKLKINEVDSLIRYYEERINVNSAISA